MKRIICFSLLIFFLFCGCSQSQTKTFTPAPFEAKISAKSDSNSFYATLKFVSNEDISITLLEPSELSGTVVSFGQDGVMVSAGEIDFPIGSTAQLTGADNAFENLFEALGAFSNSSYDINSTGVFYADGDYKFGKFKAKLDCENEKLTEIITDSFIYEFSY